MTTRLRPTAFWILSAASLLGCAVKASDVEPAAPTASADATKKAARGESFSLRVGESASIGDSLVVGLISVTKDSRCPAGVQCFWAGDATLKIWMQPKGGKRQERNLTVSGRNQAPADGWADEVRVVGLVPQPDAGREIEQAEYVATLQVGPGQPER